MDPDAALAAIRRLAKAFDEADNSLVAAGVASGLIDVVLGLDEWLTRGGYLPADWEEVR